MESNDLLLTLGKRRVKVIRTIELEGSADAIYRQLNQPAAFLHEDRRAFAFGDASMRELPREVELLEPLAFCHTPHFVELDRFADEGNPNHED